MVGEVPERAEDDVAIRTVARIGPEGGLLRANAIGPGVARRLRSAVRHGGAHGVIAGQHVVVDQLPGGGQRGRVG